MWWCVTDIQIHQYIGTREDGDNETNQDDHQDDHEET